MKKITGFLITLLLTLSGGFGQVALDSATLAKVNKSVFEVIVDKKDSSNIKYEKELPLDRIPFAIRNDKYTPIGTAFLLEDGSFWTAAHVIYMTGPSAYNKYYIRDSEGNVYQIRDILSFSTSRDFINFTAPDYKFEKGTGLKSTDKAELNTTVYSAGNALGEGIIVRNGTYTSSTFEEKNGAWKWLRFSAAASPGNSGGPLLNEKGEVLGIITMKSENENLNYALPIAEALKAPKEGVFERRYHYIMPIISGQKFYHTIEKKIELPKTLETLREELSSINYNDCIEAVNDIRKSYAPGAEKGFLAGASGALTKFMVVGSHFPLTIYMKDTNEWDYGQPDVKETKLSENGYVYYGSMAGLDFFRVRAPDSVTLEQLYSNPKLVTEYCIKASGLHRTVVNEQIRIESLGEPVQSKKYTDCWGRTWLVNYFALDFADATCITYTRILPTGVYVIMKTTNTGSIYTTDYLDIEFIADHTNLRYGGKLKFWNQYTSLPEEFESLKSPEEKKIKVSYDDKKIFCDAGPFNVTLEKNKFNFDEDTAVTIVTGYSEENGKPVCENRELTVMTDSKKNDYKMVFVRKINKPEEDAIEQIHKNWNMILSGYPPYDGTPYNQDSDTYVDMRLLPPGITEKNRDKADCCYFAAVEYGGQNKDKEAKSFAQYFLKKLKIN